MPTSKSAATRKKKRPQYTSFRIQKRIKPKEFKPLPSSWQLFRRTANLLWLHRKKVMLFLLVFALLLVVFVRGLSGGVNLTDLKEQVKESTGAEGDALVVSTVLFTNLIASTSTTTSDVAAMYQAIIILICSLAFIWILRQISASRVESFRIRDAFYRGPQQIVPFLLVLGVIALEFIPMSIGSFLLTTASGTGIEGGELFTVMIIAVLLAVLSIYLISGSIMAIYIVTLPGTNPMKALRTSSALTQLHRWSIVRKMIMFGLLVLAIFALFFIPLLVLIPDGYEFIAEGLYFIGTMLLFCFGHTYLYSLYRSLM